VALKLLALAIVLVLTNWQLTFLRIDSLKLAIKEEDMKWSDLPFFAEESDLTWLKVKVGAILILNFILPLAQIFVLFLYASAEPSATGLIYLLFGLILLMTGRNVFWQQTNTPIAILAMVTMTLMYAL